MKNLEKILAMPEVIQAYITPDNHFLKVENTLGTVITIWEQHGGYQCTMPITPNQETGSAVGITGDYWDYVNFEELQNIIRTQRQITPRTIYSENDISTIHFQTIEQAVDTHGNILQFYKVKNASDRERVENAHNVAQDENICVPVSIDFVEEMRDCVPPVTMRYGGLYHIVQCGEPANHNEKGQPLYETYMSMTQKAVDGDCADARMNVDEWYCVGNKIMTQ